MKALVYTGPLRLEYVDRPDPAPGAGEVLIRVKSVGICGSDIHGYTGSTGRRIPPIVMGHEALGVIEAAGRDTEAWARRARRPVSLAATPSHIAETQSVPLRAR